MEIFIIVIIIIVIIIIIIIILIIYIEKIPFVYITQYSTPIPNVAPTFVCLFFKCGSYTTL